jgi:8-oxo-dGTP pyrophosphatase MutT (NUDIX family)
MSIEIYESTPPGFSPQVEISACYLEFDGKVLLLERASNKSEGNKWGAPAGKLEKNEDPQTGAIRELYEETGVVIERPSQIRPLGKLYIRKGTFDYIFHLFKVDIRKRPDIKLSDEHVDYKWTTPEDREVLRLIPGCKEVLQFYFKSLQSPG